ncbi:MAG: DUF429 domain-containing protein [Anaerolineales bacterium]|jgi:hypothetical protein
MLFSRTTFIGIDPTAGQRPFTYAALDQNLELLALSTGSLEEVTAFAGGQRAAVVGINAPRQPNQGLMRDESVREQLSPRPNPGRWQSYRLVEYELYQHGISIPPTPGKVEACPRWMQMGFQVFQRLGYFGYQLFPSPEADCIYFETYPHGAYSAMLGITPFPKQTLEGRLQRQLILHENQVRVHNPMRIFEEITRYRLLNGILPLENLLNADELDALVAAYTAWVLSRNQVEVTVLGDSSEGQIVLPVPALKHQYQPASSA